jgi:hypothetical protein
VAIDTKVLDALSAPLGSLIASVGRGIADAQRELDAASLSAYREIYESDEGLFSELQRIGYKPTWYHIPEAESEIQVALTMSGTESAPGGNAVASKPKLKVYATPVDAGYASRFNFSLQASSRVKFRVVPIPPSNAVEALLVVPALVGLALGEARARLTLLGIPSTLPEVAPETIVTKQSPAPGSFLSEGTRVEVETT